MQDLLPQILHYGAWFFICVGVFFCLAGGIGILRFPDVFSRIHPAGVIDTGGAGFILAGLVLKSIEGGLTLVVIKLFLILFFLFFTGPTATHALAKASLSGGQKPWVRDKTNSTDKDHVAS